MARRRSYTRRASSRYTRRAPARRRAARPRARRRAPSRTQRLVIQLVGLPGGAMVSTATLGKKSGRPVRARY